MAIVKMKHLRLAAMQADREEILRLLQRMGCVEIDEPQVDLSDPEWAGLARPEESGLSAAQERKSAAEQALESLKRYAPEKGGLFRKRPELTEKQLFSAQARAEGEQAVRSINDTQRRIAQFQAQKSRLAAQKAALEPWLSLDVPLETQSTREVAIQFGTVPAAVEYAGLTGAVAAASELAELTLASSDRESHYLLLVCHASAEEEVLQVLKELGWSRANLRDWTGTAAENSARLDRELADLEKQLHSDEEAMSRKGKLREAVCQEIDRCAVIINREQSRARLLDTRRTFLLEGWVPADSWEEARHRLSRWPCAWEVEDPEAEDYPRVPVQLKNNWFTKPLNMVTEMYSLPAYGTVDPNPLMAPFFILFYGIMMADMGYGLLMILAGAFILLKLVPRGTFSHFAGLMVLCGVSTFIMGAVTGGFFGDFLTQVVTIVAPDYVPPPLFTDPDTGRFALPALFTPLDDTLMILVGSMCLGFVHINTGMAVSFVRKIQAGQFMDAVWEELTWWIVFAGAGLMLLNVTPIVLIAGCVLVVAGPLVQGEGFGRITGIFGSLYNHITGYFGDILSYSRLMALMLAGSVIAQVFNTLGAIPGNVIIFFVISMAGNALNFALNLLGCYVHDLRLQCLEYFGKFYQDGGKPFRPMAMNTKYVDIKEF